jgi:hypothetical protein
MPGDTDVHRLFEKSMDRDRHTEVGGPPTGQVPKEYEEPEPETRLKTTGSNKSLSTTQTGADAPGSNTKWIVLGLLALGGVGAGIFVLTRPDKPDDTVVVNPPKDAALVTPPPETTGTVYLVTTPPGAKGTVNGQPLTTPTPVKFSVPIGKAKIHLELEGYLPLDDELTVLAGNNNFTLPFASAPAKLHVTTDPVGASVALAGRNLGITPLDRADLTAVKDATLTLSKPGFETLSFKVTLVAGKQVDIDRTLKAAQKFGTAQIRFKGPGFGDVYLNNKKLGQAPMQSVKLPIGVNKLRLINPVAKVEWDLTCVVTEAGPNICETKQP